MAYIFSDKIMSTMVETKNLDQIVVEITLDKDSANFEKPAVKDVIEFLFQENILRSGNVSVLSGRQFKRLREADGGVKYLPKLWIKGVLSKSKLGYDLLLSIDSEGERIKDTIISFNEPATFLTDKVTPLTLEIFRLNHIKVIKNIAITESWDAAENFVIGRRAWFRLDKTDAKKAFGKAMSDDPKFTLAKLKYLEVLKFEGGNSSQISTLMSEIKSEISNLSPIDSIRTLAIEKSLNGEFRKAIPFYKQIAEKLPQSKYSYYEIAEAYYELRDNDNAIQYYLKALEKDSVFALALNHLAYSYMDKFEMDKALNCFRKYLSLDKSANSYDSMADGFYAAGMIDSAIIYKRKGIELDPSLEYLHSGLGLFYTMKKDTKNAEFAFNNYFELVKDNQEQSITALFNFAFIAYSKNKLDSAEILIDKSIAKLGNVESIFGYQENFWLKGIILFDKGDYKGLDNIISLFAEAVKKYNFSKEDYHPVYKFFVHLQILKAISDQDKAKVNELMDVLTTDIKFKVRDHGSIFDYAYLSRNLYTVFSSNKFKNDKAANEAKQNAIKANPAYERMF
jgi:superkiller protein 3